MRLLLLIILVFGWTSKGINAQNIANSTIKSNTYKKAITLPKKNNNYLLTRELEAYEPGRPIQFAVSDTLKANVKNSGKWSTIKAGIEAWTLEVESEGALSINLGFKTFKLPEGAELFIYNKSRSYAIGPFTSLDNEDHLQLWTPIIKGDKVVIELLVPSDKKEEVLLELNHVSHDFMGFGKSFSGSCNLDVVCGEEDGFEMVDEFRDIIRSVGAYHINGVVTCSGALVNNTLQDKRGFFLTAEHCGISVNNAPSVVTYWNFENSFCRLPNSSESGNDGDGDLDQFNTGCILRAENASSDFCLIEFDDPIQPEYNPYYSGWKRDFVSTEMAICIHHPGVEEKRISFEFDEVVRGVGNFIEVEDWDVGTTEGGSSGSPLFTEDKKIIGQLQGGLASCNNDLSDNYGNFGISWFGSGTPSTSLRFWLDPMDLDLMSIDGFEGNFGLEFVNNFQRVCSLESDTIIVEVKVEDSFTSFVNIEVEDLPSPLELVFSEDNLTPGATTQLVFINANGMTSGEYEIVLSSTDGINTVENEFVFFVEDVIPEVLTPLAPVNGFAEARNEQALEWTGNLEDTYDLQVSTDPSFIDLFFEESGIEDTGFNLIDLKNLITYYWRVRGENDCGKGEWSEVFQFTTQVTYCIQVQSEEFLTELSPVSTHENLFGLLFKYDAIIEKISIPNIDLEHSYINDLDLELINPETNERTILVNRICDNQENMFFGFSDIGIENIPCPPVDGRLYRPEEQLRSLIDFNAQGIWELLVRDNANFDGGVFKTWEIEVCFSESENEAIIPLESTAIACEGGKISVPFYYNLNGESISEIIVEFQGTPILIEDIGLPLDDSGELEITFSENVNLVPGNYEFFISFDDYVGTEFFVQVLDSPQVSLDLSFANGATIEALGMIEWEGSFVDTYTIEISTTSDFTELIWFSEQEGNIESVSGPLLNDGEYYLRIIGKNECDSISSELYNFSVDETVSIIESTKKPLLISQSLTEDVILISGNSDNAQTNVAVISISGHKLLTQNFKEESLLLDVSALVPGVYLIHLRSGEEQIIQKIVVY